MKKRTFGTTGIDTTVIGLGGMPLSIDGRPDEKAGERVVHAADVAEVDAHVGF